MRNKCLFFGKLQSAFFQELPHDWQHFFLQKFRRFARDDKIIGVAHEIHFGEVFLAVDLAVGEPFVQKPFQTVQRHVHKDGGNRAALRRTFLRREQTMGFHKSAFQPFSKNLSVHRNILQQPFVTDVVEAAFDITFQYPLRRFSFVQIGEALLYSVVCTPTDSESVGVRVGVGFGYRFQREFVESLHGAVRHGWYTKRTHFPVFLGNVNSSERLRGVTPPVESEYCLEFCLRRQP